MKIIYYNKKIFIDLNNVSAYNVLLKLLETINIPVKNIDNFYLTSLEGHPLKNSHLMNNKKTYYLKRRLVGASSLTKTGNSVPLIIFTGVVFGVVSVIYYWIYLRLILTSGVTKKDRTKLDAFAVTNMRKHAAYPDQLGGNAQEIKNKAVSKAKNFFSKIGDWFNNTMQDKNVGIYLCYTRGVDPYFTTKEDEGSIASTFSSVLFFIYIFVLVVTIFTNTATKAICGQPSGKFIFMALIFMLIPLIIAFFAPKIADAIDFLLAKTGKPRVMGNFRLLLCNVILIVILTIYMIVNKKGISGNLLIVLLPAIILFALFQFPVGGFSIDKLFSNLSTKVSNFILETTRYNEVPDYPNGEKYSKNKSPLPNSNNNRNKLPMHNIRECFERFEFIYFILKAGLMAFIGFGLITIIYGSQVTKICKK